MTHCLYCGAERESDQCDACGLSTEAAGEMLRKRLIWRTAWFLVGAVLFVPVSQAFPALELDGILIFVGALFFIVLGLGLWIIHRARRGQEIEVIKRIYFGLLPVPWILAALLFINGRFDNGHPHRETARVVGKFNVAGAFRSQRLEVTSWREGRRIERLPVSRDDFTRFQLGDPVIVEIQSGLMGIPWVYAVFRP